MRKPTKAELIRHIHHICTITANPNTISGVKDMVTAMRLIDTVWMDSFRILEECGEIKENKDD
jgi:hypothetical protein